MQFCDKSSLLSSDIPPTVHQVLMLDPIPIANMAGRDKLMLECSASGNPAPVIEWSFNGKKFVDGEPTGDDEKKQRFELRGNTYNLGDRGEVVGNDNR